MKRLIFGVMSLLEIVQGRKNSPLSIFCNPLYKSLNNGLTQKVSPECISLLLPVALQGLADQLLQQLSGLWAPCLEVEFSITRATNRLNSDSFLQSTEWDDRTRPHHQYRGFVNQLLTRGLAAFFREYSVLGRLTTELMQHWVEASSEFLTRFIQDYGRLQRTLISSQAGRIASISAGLSDPHDDSRCVLSMTFEDGSQLIYKPRDLTVDLAFENLLNWLEQRGLPLSLKMPQVLNCGNYGWVEYIKADPCPDTDAVDRYYRRAGQLLALLYGLGAIDFHYENIIAHGEYPVLIDCETVLHPRLNITTREMATPGMIADDWLSQTALGVGLLPVSVGASNSAGFDISGLGWSR